MKLFSLIPPILLVFFGIFYGDSLLAREKVHIEFSIGSPKTIVSEDASSERFKDLYYIYDLIPLIQSPNQERANLGLYKSSVFKQSEIINTNFRFGFEYRLFPLLGLGASYNQSSVTVTNVLPGDYLVLFSSGIPPEPPKNSPPEAGNFTTLFARDLRSTITTGELEASLHLLPNSKKIDPFLRIGYGRAIRGVFGSSEKFTYTGGLRYIHNERVSISLEYFKGDLFGNLGRTDFSVEKGWRIGFGIYF